MIFGVCVTDDCRKEQAKQQCANQLGLPYPQPLPEREDFFNCWQALYNGSSTGFQTAVNDLAGLLGIYNSIRDGTNTNNQPTPGIVIPPKQTVLGMPPAVGYIVIILAVAGAGFGIYKLATKK